MEKTNALAMRQSLGKIIKKLKNGGAPIMIEKNREPAAVLISLEDYKKRFVDQIAAEGRKSLIEEINKAKIKLPKGKTSLDIINEIRS